MNKFPYLWITLARDGEWQAIPITEEQRWLLVQLRLDLVQLDIHAPTGLPDGFSMTDEINTMRPNLPRAFDILENARKFPTEKQGEKND